MRHSLSRRHLLASLPGAAIASLVPGSSQGIEPFRRPTARIKGLSLTTYSLKPHMRWWWGKETEGTMEMLDFLEYAAKLSLDGVELTSYFFKLPVTSTDLLDLKRRAHVLGLDITGGAMGNNFSHAPGSKVTRQQMTAFREWIDHFALLGAPVVRVFAARGLPQGVPDETIIENVIANLQEALQYAASKGVMLGLENHDFVTNIDYLLQIVKAIDSPWLGVIWDSANLAPTPDPYADLERIAPYAITAQVKVMTKVNGKDAPADLDRLIAILKAARFRGHLVLEYEEEEDPFEGIPKFLQSARNALAQA